MIIITGMDNTGKTTLTKELSELIDMEVINSPGPVMAQIQKDWVLNAITSRAEVIYERFPLFEEVVYGNVLRGSSPFTYGDNYFKLLEMSKPIIVYTRPIRSTIFNFGDRPQMDGVIEEKEKLLAEYDELMLRLVADGWRILVYNYEVNEVEDIAMAYGTSKLMNILKGEI